MRIKPSKVTMIKSQLLMLLKGLQNNNSTLLYLLHSVSKATIRGWKGHQWKQKKLQPSFEHSACNQKAPLSRSYRVREIPATRHQRTLFRGTGAYEGQYWGGKCRMQRGKLVYYHLPCGGRTLGLCQYNNNTTAGTKFLRATKTLPGKEGREEQLLHSDTVSR